MYELKSLTIDFQQMSLILKNGEKKQLGLKDFKVLQLLIDKSPEVLSRDEILNKVWGEDQFPTSRTVDNCILRLRQALGGDYIKSIRAVGYQWQEESE
ncbi:MAG: winged helix-turn-helix domain-containing protein [Bdellovibrionales bacterium]|nr:winged helix-turn-helix domain-containing protein [Bdellovibrionales bacterium]